jgi:hypothetical protein
VLVFQRPLVFLTGLTVGDYLLWKWSLAGNHVALALVAGFTLVPLAIVTALLLAVMVARLIARSTRRPAERRRVSEQPTHLHPLRAAAGRQRGDAAGASRTSRRRSSRKLAA